MLVSTWKCGAAGHMQPLVEHPMQEAICNLKFTNTQKLLACSSGVRFTGSKSSNPLIMSKGFVVIMARGWAAACTLLRVRWACTNQTLSIFTSTSDEHSSAESWCSLLMIKIKVLWAYNVNGDHKLERFPAKSSTLTSEFSALAILDYCCVQC